MSGVRTFSFALVAACFLLTGCETLPKPDGATSGPFYQPANVHRVVHLPENLRRVVVLPCAGQKAFGEPSLDRIDDIILTGLNKAAPAETVSVTREELARYSGRRELDSTSALPATLLAKLDAATGGDAVLFTDITSYSAYPPLQIGLRFKLVSLTNGEILWAFDNLFDASKQEVENSARRHYSSTRRSAHTPADLSSTVLQNPGRFAAYAVDAAFGTLPSR